jgi:excisionase family DNA binding protein
MRYPEIDHGPPPPLLTREEVGDRLQVSDTTVKRLLASGQLPAVRIGRTVRVHADDLLAFIDRHRSEPAGGES